MKYFPKNAQKTFIISLLIAIYVINMLKYSKYYKLLLARLYLFSVLNKVKGLNSNYIKQRLRILILFFIFCYLKYTMSFQIKPCNSLETYSFVVIVSILKSEKKLILSQREGLDTWEFQGGHIEIGESPEASARRELYEEAGIIKSKLIYLCDYITYEADTHETADNNLEQARNGKIFLALVRERINLPKSEIKKVNIFDKLPEKLSYPEMMNLIINNLVRL